ncbi:hypothetical protein DY000_02024054 [Brassica cretica]|uniref:Uncharacterized protein n=1 Tax=Brassica cretica TaxID=69181 RepID=A0ABQ7EGE4_BRACR|nr:hypothetical protein DY000_02024054 [Brassica cretica]
MSVSVLLSIVGDVAGIQVDMLDFIGLRVLNRRPVEWDCEVEFSSADFCRSAKEDRTVPCRQGFDLFCQGIHEFVLFFRPLFVRGEHLFESSRTLVSQRSRISANTTRQAIRIRNKDEKDKKSKREQSRSYSEFAFERYNKVRAWATRGVGEIPSSKTLKLLNLIESQLE